MEKTEQDDKPATDRKPPKQNGHQGLGRPDEGKTAGQSGGDEAKNRSSDPNAVQQ